MKQVTTMVQWVVTAGFSFACTFAFAAADINRKWDELINDPDFHYRDQKEALQKLEPAQNNILDKLGGLLLSFFTSPTGKFIGWIVFFVFLAWILFKIFTGNFPLFGKKTTAIQETMVENEEEILANTNWEQHLQLAIHNADNRLAIRYSFMRMLQLLQQNNLIHFEDNKTNTDYYNELTRLELKRDFKHLSRQYEHTWYGHYRISDEAYHAYMITFDNLKSTLPQS